MSRIESNAVIIPLAWPDLVVGTSFKRIDPVFELLRICKNNYYRVGHAAMLLINLKTGQIQYYDFGRYISPGGYGRVRGANTDPELAIDFKANIVDNEIVNFSDILIYIANLPDTHGGGVTYAGKYYGFNFEKIVFQVNALQKRGLIRYGPFVYKGTNCSRFVAQIIGNNTKVRTKFKFLYPWYLTPSPLGNIFNCPTNKMYEVKNDKVKELEIDTFISKARFLKQKVLFDKDEEFKEGDALKGYYKPVAPLPKGTSKEAVWLGGLGAGAWHSTKVIDDKTIQLTRTQSDGKEDFCDLFILGDSQYTFNKELKFEIMYGTNYEQLVIKQNNQLLYFKRVH